MNKKSEKENNEKGIKISKGIGRLSFDLFILMVLTLFLMGSMETIYKNESNDKLFNYTENICASFNCNYVNFSFDNYKSQNFTNLDFVYYKFNNIFVQDIVLGFYDIGKKNSWSFFIVYFLYLFFILFEYLISPIWKKLKGGEKNVFNDRNIRGNRIGSNFWD